MLPFIESKRPDIESLCRTFHVRRLEVFGSATRGNFDPMRSDVDFLVEFDSIFKLFPLDGIGENGYLRPEELPPFSLPRCRSLKIT